MTHHRKLAARAARSVSSRKGLAISVALGLAAVPAVAFAPIAAATPPSCIVSINGGPHTHYATLQDAVSAAALLTNPTLRLYSDCTGDTTIAQDMTITGGPSGATLHGGNSSTSQGTVVSVPSGTDPVTLANLDITGGYGFKGGGINNDGSLTLNNVTVKRNTATDGGGIFNNTSGSLYFGGRSGTSITGNTATDAGGGMFNNGFLSGPIVGAAATSTNASINNNTVTGTGTGSCFTAPLVVCDGGGGGIFNAGTAVLGDTSVNGNTALQGGGIYNGIHSVTLNNASVNGNTATTGNGGGIYNLATLTATDTGIKNNHATAGTGGGIYNTGSATLSGSVTVTSNTAKTDGGGIFNTGSLFAPAGDVFGNTPDNIS
jgi:predicted outer membrane repeat protein